MVKRKKMHSSHVTCHIVSNSINLFIFTQSECKVLCFRMVYYYQLYINYSLSLHYLYTNSTQDEGFSSMC